MLHVICLNAFNYQDRGRDYVHILHDSVRRNLPAGFEGTFEVFTDDADGYHPDIIVRPLPEVGLGGWWNKLALFKPGLFTPGDRVIYFDLDTLITGRLDDIVKYDGDFAALRDVYRPHGLQSSVMAWRAGVGMSDIWALWDIKGRPEVDGGDQIWIEDVLASTRALPFDRLQDLYPDLFASYKITGGKLPAKASVVFFHGFPRPHQVTTGWVPEVWKIGGLMRAELDTVANTEHEKLFANVRASSARDLRWLDYAEAHDGHAAIVGGGPSAARFIDEIRLRQQHGQQVWALNGAAEWLLECGIVADAQIIVDARPETAALLAPGLPHHFIASQCDSSIFDRVSPETTTLWHSNAAGIEDVLQAEAERPVHLIGGGSTVGLSAMVVAQVLGFRQIHLYGYDSSYAADDVHHAYPQAINDADLVVDVVAGEHRFRAAPWMVTQAQEFVSLATWLAEVGCVITVHGDGLLPAIAHDMVAHPRYSGAQLRAAEVLARLPAGPVIGAEIGVFAGDMSRQLLDRSDLQLLMVDSWEGDGKAYAGDSGDWHSGLTQTKQDDYRASAQRVASASGRGSIIAARSGEAAKFVADGTLDFVFIDADHSYDGVKADIAAWLPKLKPGGLLSGHDYDNPEFPKFGVARAVDEFVAGAGLQLELGANLTWFVSVHDLSERERHRA